MSIIEKFEKVILKEEKSFLSKSNLSEKIKLVDSILPQKSTYSFPMMDTIGRISYAQMQSKLNTKISYSTI